jgi:putative membrane protein
MMWYDGGGGWLWMTLMMVIVWGGLIVVAVWVVRSGLSSRRESDAMDVLRRRLAAGEISQEDFEKTKRILQA